MSVPIEQKIEEVLELVRPRLAMHKGDVEFVGFDQASGVVQVRMTGTCDGCPLAGMTLKMGIEALMQEQVPEVTAVQDVTAANRQAYARA